MEAAPAALHGKGGLFSFTKENSPLSIPQEKGFDWQSEARTAFIPPECKCLRAASPRLVLLYDLTLSYYPLLRSACSYSSTRPTMSGVEGFSPRLSLGVPKGVFSLERKYPLPRVPTAVGQNTAPFGHPKREYSFRCMNKKRSTNKRKLRITYHEQNENRYDHCLRTA